MVVRLSGFGVDVIKSLTAFKLLPTLLSISTHQVEKLLTYYPFLEDEGADKKKFFWQKKSGGSYANIYNVMYEQGFTKPQHNAIREEMKWRRWVDEVFVHTLSPNIYR